MPKTQYSICFPFHPRRLLGFPPQLSCHWNTACLSDRMEVSEYESIIIFLIQKKYPKAIKSSKAKKRNFTYFDYFAPNLQILDLLIKLGIIENIFRKFIDNHCANFYTNPYTNTDMTTCYNIFRFLHKNGLKCLVWVIFSLVS